MGRSCSSLVQLPAKTSGREAGPAPPHARAVNGMPMTSRAASMEPSSAGVLGGSHRRGSFGSFGNLASQLNTFLTRDAKAFSRMVAEDNGEKEEADVYRKNVRAQPAGDRWAGSRRPSRLV